MTCKIQSLIISLLSDNYWYVEMYTLMCELQFYFCLSLYNYHLIRLINTPTSALLLLLYDPPTVYFQPWCPPLSTVCPTKLSVAVCQSVIHQLSALERGKQSRKEDGKPWLLLNGHLAGAHIY